MRPSFEILGASPRGLAFIATLCCPGIASAQCPRFDGFSVPGVDWGGEGGDGRVLAMTTHDDGSGPALFLGGQFHAAGDVRSDLIVKYQGGRFHPVLGPGGRGLRPQAVRALCVFDDGSGPALFLGGVFHSADGVPAQGIVKWDGERFERLGSGLSVSSPSDSVDVQDLATFDDGSGEKLYAAGNFTSAGGLAVPGIAAWDGASWSPLAGVTGDYSLGLMDVFDAGSGPELYVSGVRILSPGVFEKTVFRWDRSLGLVSTTSGYLSGAAGVWAMTVFDDGSGAALYIGGAFQQVAGFAASHVARLDSTGWSPAGSLPSYVFGFGTWDMGSGPRLHAATLDDGVLEWTGSSWAPVPGADTLRARCLGSYDDGAGDEPYFGGDDQVVQGRRLAGAGRFHSSQWEALAPDLAKAGRVDTFVVYDDGSGPAVLSDRLRDSMDRMERRDPAGWSPVTPSVDGEIHAAAMFDAGGGPELYVAGQFDAGNGIASIARFDGSQWHALVPIQGYPPMIRCLRPRQIAHTPVLLVGGGFSFFDGVGFSHDVAAWDGSSWISFGNDVNGNALPANDVVALELFDSGSGPELHVATWNKVLRWSGSDWSDLGTVNGSIAATAVFDEGSGERLFVAGLFTDVSGVPAAGIASWNGTSWSAPPGIPPTSGIEALALHDFGSGPRLVAGGTFASIGGVPARSLAAFDGAAWSPVGAGIEEGTVDSLLSFAPPSAPAELWIGGMFANAGGRAAPYVTVSRIAPGCCDPTTYCTPSVNSHGCAPAIRSTGEPSIGAGTLRVEAVEVVNHKVGLLFWGPASSEAPFQVGFKCVAPPVARTPPMVSGGNPGPDDCSGLYQFHWSTSYLQSNGLTAGQSVHCQFWMRDPQGTSPIALTAALRFTLCP